MGAISIVIAMLAAICAGYYVSQKRYGIGCTMSLITIGLYLSVFR